MTTRETLSERIAGLSATAVVLALIISPTLQARSDAVSSELNQDMLGQVQTLYGMDRDQAIERLAREEMAAETYLLIRSAQLPGYAGAWFDDTSLSLQVATNDPAERKLIEHLGGRPVLMAFSLSELETVRTRAQSLLSGNVAVRESHIDYKTNRVVIGVAPSHLQQAQSTIGMLSQQTDMIQVSESKGHILTSSGNVRGGNGARNYTWQQAHPDHESYPFPCSIGASVEGGYVTAGHCGRTTHEMRTPSGQSLGEVKGSTLTIWGTYLHGEDGAWVETVSGWTPSPQINGYDDGIFSIPATWAGLLEAPIGGTVCRYGQTTGGPHCGQILEKNKDFPSSGRYGFTTASGSICTVDGDSGGPYLTPLGQMQGMNHGAFFPGEDPENTCPDDPPIPPDYVIFQPIWPTLNRFSRNMLTTHGANAPSAYNLNCPDAANSGGGQFFCTSSFKSQGATDMTWTFGGNQFSGPSMFGTCSQGSNVSVSLTISNPYGTDVQNISFPCPSGPIP